MAEIKCEVQLDYPTSGTWNDITDKVTGVDISRGLDRRTGRAKAGVCRIHSTTADPWVGPWRNSGRWYEGDLIGVAVRVMLTVYNADLSSTREIVYEGHIDEVSHGTSEVLHEVTLGCLDLWGGKIAHMYVDSPALPNETSTRTRFNELMTTAGFTLSTNYTGTPDQRLRRIGAAEAKPKQRLVQALQEVIDAENGYLMVDRFNVLHFKGHPSVVGVAKVGVTDTPDVNTASFVRPPKVVLDTDRLVNAVIVIAADEVDPESESYDENWGTAKAGSVKAKDADYSVPWDSSGSGTGGSGATEAVATDQASIAVHGRYELRQKTGVRASDAQNLADEILSERSELHRAVPKVEVAVDAETAAVARLLLELDLDSYLEVEFKPRDYPFIYADVAPVIQIGYKIRPLDMANDRVSVDAVYGLHRGTAGGTAGSWWQVGISHLGTETVVGFAGLTATPGEWIRTEVVDVTQLRRLSAQVVSRYADDSDRTAAESAVAITPDYRYSINEATKAFQQWDPVIRSWRTIGKFITQKARRRN